MHLCINYFFLGVIVIGKSPAHSSDSSKSFSFFAFLWFLLSKLIGLRDVYFLLTFVADGFSCWAFVVKFLVQSLTKSVVFAFDRSVSQVSYSMLFWLLVFCEFFALRFKHLNFCPPTLFSHVSVCSLDFLAYA